MGDINLFPKRVILGDRERTASIGLYNRAAASGDYEITISDMVMMADGRLIDLASIADPTLRDRARPASSYLRWSPRRVSLPANEAQMVRIMARAPSDLPVGEYRAHFTVVSVPPENAELAIEGAEEVGMQGVGVRIVPRFGISIPVILRIGETSVSAGLKDLSVTTLREGGRSLTLTITRTGNRSSFGDLLVSAPGARKPLAQAKGIGVYTEVDQRTVQIPIDPEADPRLTSRGSRLVATYIDDDATPGKVLTRQEFIVP